MRTVLVSLLVVATASCGDRVAFLKAKIEGARICEKASECVDLGSHCPFGCNVVVNLAQSQELISLLSDFENSGGQQCAYGCVQLDRVDCQNKLCTPIYTKP